LSSSEDNNKAGVANLLPDGYDIIHLPRVSKGGGVALIHRKQYRVRIDKTMQFSSFEYLTSLLDIASFTFRIVVIYCVPPSEKNTI